MMSDLLAQKFRCDGCGKEYAIRPELAGRKVKCKCGLVRTMPISGDNDEAGIYDLIDPPPPTAPVRPAARTAPPVPGQLAAPSARSGSKKASTSSKPALSYERGPTQREKDRHSAANLIDKRRDVIVPTVLLVIGLIALFAVTLIAGRATAGEMVVFTLALGIVTVLKTGIMIGSAFLIAPLLGVSFGGIGTACLKLAAIAVCSDAATVLFNQLLAILGAPGMRGAGLGIGFVSPLSIFGGMSGLFAAGVIWVMVWYLFDMEGLDAWYVVLIMAALRFVLGWLLVMLVYSIVISGLSRATNTINAEIAGAAGAV
jgi:uncharacterized membrane-anchored protein